MKLSEEEIVEEILKRVSRMPQPGVNVGIGDDAAVLAPPSKGEKVLFSSDQVVERTHFIPNLHPPRSLGHKCLARALSDIAAMGGAPRHFVLSLSLPTWVNLAWFRAYLGGLMNLSKRCSVPLVGGDVAAGLQFTAGVTVVGVVEDHRLLLRNGAKPGDTIFVSGQLGGSALGFARLSSKNFPISDAAIRRHLYPRPRLELGLFLRDALGVSSAMDLSDGLSTDLPRLVKASGVGATIDEVALPRFLGASSDQALHGGEDYELLFTVPAEKKIPRSFRRTRLTKLGKIRAEAGIDLQSDGRVQALSSKGFRHFTIDAR